MAVAFANGSLLRVAEHRVHQRSDKLCCRILYRVGDLNRLGILLLVFLRKILSCPCCKEWKELLAATALRSRHSLIQTIAPVMQTHSYYDRARHEVDSVNAT